METENEKIELAGVKTSVEVSVFLEKFERHTELFDWAACFKDANAFNWTERESSHEVVSLLKNVVALESLGILYRAARTPETKKALELHVCSVAARLSTKQARGILKQLKAKAGQ